MAVIGSPSNGLTANLSAGQIVRSRRGPARRATPHRGVAFRWFESLSREQKIKAIHLDGFYFLATSNGLEPSTSSVTGWRANRLHHEAICKQCCSNKRNYTRRLAICKVFFCVFFIKIGEGCGIRLPFRYAECKELFPSSRTQADIHRTTAFRRDQNLLAGRESGCGIRLPFRCAECKELFPSSRKQADVHRTSAFGWVRIP